MKELVTADGMRQIEKHAMEKLQLSDAILMERAALYAAAVLEKELKKRGRKSMQGFWCCAEPAITAATDWHLPVSYMNMATVYLLCFWETGKSRLS